MLQLESVKILVISKNEDDGNFLRDYFSHLNIPEPTFVVGKIAPSDNFDFLVFNAISLPPVWKIEDLTILPETDQDHFFLLERYLDHTAKNILFYGKQYYNLNQNRCPSANSKFTLFARMRELVDFLNFYR